MSIQKLHYENLGGILVRREGLLTWRCPLCKAEGHSTEVMRTCLECGSKEAALPGAQPATSVPDGWKLVPIEPTKEMIQKACSDHGYPYGDPDVYARGYRSMLTVAPEAKP